MRKLFIALLVVLISIVSSYAENSDKTKIEKIELGKWKITRYYSVERGQKRYFGGSFNSDFSINCQGSCYHTADGTDLREKDPYTIVACPKNFKLGAKFWIEEIGYVVCHDRGGSINGKRLDVWSGIGDDGLDNLYNHPEKSGWLQVITYKEIET